MMSRWRGTAERGAAERGTAERGAKGKERGQWIGG
jgi:hypothetical protein